MGERLSTRLPKELAEKLQGYEFTRHPYDESQAEIQVLRHPDKSTLYLKIRQGTSMQIETEYNMLKWINQRVPTPETIHYEAKESREYLLTSEVSGTTTYQVDQSERETAVKILAETLKLIHSLDTKSCPTSHSVGSWINVLTEKGIDASYLADWRPDENPVFTHDDYCLPNILVQDAMLSGVIDWDYAGLADPYVDFVSYMGSIRYNFGEEAGTLIQVFLETYGVELDQAKYDFYKRLNELIP